MARLMLENEKSQNVGIDLPYASAWALVAILSCIVFVDYPLDQAIGSVPGEAFARLRLLTALGNSALYLVPLAIAIVTVWLLKRRARPRDLPLVQSWLGRLTFVFTAIAVSGLAVNLLKIIIGRGRPRVIDEHGLFAFSPFTIDSDFASLPSGHADTIFVLATIAVFAFPRWRVLIWSTASWLALTRVLIGAHFLSDVVAGAALGILTTLWLRRRFLERGWLKPPVELGSAEGLVRARIDPGRQIRVTLQLILAASLVFVSLPALDIWASRFMFDSDSGRFAAADVLFWQRLRDILSLLVFLLCGLSILGLISGRWLRPYAPWPDSRTCLFVILVAVVGPLLTVNIILKDQFGRPRPYQTTVFEGDKTFQPAWRPSAECPRNCSFVAGDVSAAWMLAAPAISLLSGAALALVLGTVSLFTAVIGFARFTVGSHFLSDVVLSFLLTHLVICICYHWLYERNPGWSRAGRIDRAMGSLGARARTTLGIANSPPKPPPALGLAMQELIDDIRRYIRERAPKRTQVDIN